MINPFKVTGLAVGEDFFNRRNEIKKLTSHIYGGQHTLILSPRRMGKTSLLIRLQEELKKDVIFVYVDLLKSSDTTSFITTISSGIFKSLKSPIKKMLALMKTGLPSWSPRVSMSPTGDIDFGFKLEPQNIDLKMLEELFFWFDKVYKNKRKVIVFDEFQEIRNYDKDYSIEKHLRSIVQELKHTTCFFSGSLPTLLKEMFTHNQRSFYKMCFLFELNFCPKDDALAYLEKKFKTTKISLEHKKEIFDTITHITQCHPYYVQIYGYYTFDYLSEKIGMKYSNITSLMREVESRVFSQERNYFESQISHLSALQKQVLIALAKEPAKEITSEYYLRKFMLPSHSSVRKTVGILERDGYVCKTPSLIYLYDPIFARWLVS